MLSNSLPHQARIVTSAFLFLTLLALPTSLALRVATGSSCAQLCTDSTASASSSTASSELVCHDFQYNTTAEGTRFQACINCELQSNHVDQASGESDQAWAIYNLRYAFDTCVYGFPDSDASASNPCVVSCTPIQQSLEGGIKQPTPSQPFGYCSDGAFMAKVGQCTYCYSLLEDQKYLASFLNVLQLGCEEQPAVGVGLTNCPPPFSPNPSATSVGNIVLATAAPTSSASSSSSHGGLSIGAKVGIGLGALVVFIILVTCITVTINRSRRKLKLQRQMSPWAGGPPQPFSPPIPPPHSPAWPRPTFAPYTDVSPINNHNDESPITPLERIFYPKGVTTVRETEMEMVEQKGQPPQGDYVWPEQQRKLRLQTHAQDWQQPGRKSSYTTFPSADGKEISPLSFT